MRRECQHTHTCAQCSEWCYELNMQRHQLKSLGEFSGIIILSNFVLYTQKTHSDICRKRFANMVQSVAQDSRDWPQVGATWFDYFPNFGSWMDNALGVNRTPSLMVKQTQSDDLYIINYGEIAWVTMRKKSRANYVILSLTRKCFLQLHNFLPFNICGTQFNWIGVGLDIPTASHWLTSHSFKPNSANVLELVSSSVMSLILKPEVYYRRGST